MQVLTKRVLREFGLDNSEVAKEILAWFAAAEAAEWDNRAVVSAFDKHTDYVDSDRWVFNLRHNCYRLVVRIFFLARQVYMRFIGTHADYARIVDITSV